MARRFTVQTLIRKHDAPTTIATLTLLLSNSGVASSGFRVSSVTLNIPLIRREFGRSTNTVRLQCYAAAAGINYPLRNTSNAIRSARSAAADSIRDALATTSFTLNLRAWTSSYTFD